MERRKLMAIHDYRFNPFENTFDIKKIFDETHVIPSNSPYTIRLAEVPQKTSPTTLQVKFQNGELLTEVAEEPAQGQYWPDYLTTEHGIEGWNTGTLKFSAADAGKTVLVTYNGMGTLTDDRLIDQVEIAVTSSTQADKDARVSQLEFLGCGNRTYIGTGTPVHPVRVPYPETPGYPGRNLHAPAHPAGTGEPISYGRILEREFSVQLQL
jgi:hypothetical protein